VNRTGPRRPLANEPREGVRTVRAHNRALGQASRPVDYLERSTTQGRRHSALDYKSPMEYERLHALAA